MPVSYLCHCGCHVKIPDQSSGKVLLCPRCRTRIPAAKRPHAPLPPSEPEAGPPSAGTVPWESSGNILARYWRTVGKALLHPDQLFSGCVRQGDRVPPLTYTLATGLQLALLFVVLEIFLMAIRVPKSTPAGGPLAPMVYLATFSVMVTLIMPVVVPAVLAAGIYVWTCLNHLCARMLGGRGAFADTLRVTSYGSASTCWISLIPLVGPFVSGIWSLVINYFGLRRLHGLSRVRTVLVLVLAPVALLVVALLVAAVFATALSMARAR